MTVPVFERLTQLLDSRLATYQVLRHAPVFTSAEAAQVRGTTLGSGAKALVVKADDQWVMIVMPADRSLDSKHVRKSQGLKSLRFATKEEVLELTGLEPGSIPPFGQLFGLPTWCDEALQEEPVINFNAGDHAISISLPCQEYVRVEAPSMGVFGNRT